MSLVLAALAVPAFARTVTVTSCDRATALVAAWSPYDVGNAVTNVRETVYVGAVDAAETAAPHTAAHNMESRHLGGWTRAPSFTDEYQWHPVRH